jgi:hypothetical protein
MDDIIKSFLCDGNAYVSINISQHNGMDSIKVFLPVSANVRHPQEGCDKAIKAILKTLSNIECMLTNNNSYRFKSINILLHVGPWLCS